MWIVLSTAPVKGEMACSEVIVQKHRCLVAGPVELSSGAPVVLILHGLGGNADNLFPLCEQLNLPACRFVLPDAPLHFPGYPAKGYAWYDFGTNDRKEIEESRKYLFKVIDRFAFDE